jgi:glycosyltransferase involved in cell wall biosynthesis
MRIAFDLRRIKNPGIGRYMKCLAEAVVAQAPEHQYLLILPPDAAQAVAVENGRAERLVSSIPYYSIREQFALPRFLQRHRVDVFHSPHFNLPLIRPCSTVVTIHDVIYLACKDDLPSRVGRVYYRGMIAASVRLADRVLTDSQFSKADIVRYLNADPAKIEVVYPAVDPRFRRVRDERAIQSVLSRYRVEGDYILYTGIYKPRKNHAALLRAFRELLKSGCKATLVIAGPIGEGEAELCRLAEQLGIAKHMVVAGFIPDSDLPALYSGARVYACPSLYEGFGFTVLEAMACGVPVVCSGHTSLPEIAGDAALYADPQNPSEFAEAVASAFSGGALREQLIEKGYKNCARFRWETAAQDTLAAYQHAAGVAVEKVVCA